jgi:hypothetical protein
MFTDLGLGRLLRTFTKLEKLALPHGAGITGNGFDHCGSVSRLRRINFNHCPINQAGLKAIGAKAINVEALDIGGNARLGKTAIDLLSSTRFGFRALHNINISVISASSVWQ